MEHASNVLFSIGPLEITSTVTTTWAIILVLTVFSAIATHNLKDVPGRIQAAAELAVGKLRDYFGGILGRKHAERYFPIFATFFIFIIVSNYSGLLPGMGHDGQEGVSRHGPLYFHDHDPHGADGPAHEAP